MIEVGVFVARFLRPIVDFHGSDGKRHTKRVAAGWLADGWVAGQLSRKSDWHGITDSSSGARFESIVKTYRKRVASDKFCSCVWCA